MRDFDELVGAVYDCAANPELWPDTLCQLRDAVGSAYALVGHIDRSDLQVGRLPITVRRNSPWDEGWLDALDEMIARIPDGEKLFFGPTDVAWTQMMHQDEAAFQTTPFYNHWVAPQNLRDTLNVSYLQRDGLLGVLAMPSFQSRELYVEKDRLFAQRISPHIRRAMLINDLTDKGRMAMTLYRQVLDTLSVSVFVVGLGRRMVFTNSYGDALLQEESLLQLNGGSLQARRVAGDEAAFDNAIDRALKGDVAIGIAGIGVPLIGNGGERAAAYVLPIAGRDVRGDLGPGHCVVFIARRGEQQPIAIEILRTLYDLTVSEARVASMLAQGEGPLAIADLLLISVNTVRTHLKHAYAKTNTHDQTSLSGLVNRLLPPIRA